MMKFQQYLTEAGAKAGKLELVNTPLTKAIEFAQTLYNGDLYDHIPNFDKNYTLAQNQAGTGKTKRKDMPVIDDKDVKNLQRHLEGGYIDVKAPFSDDKNKNDIFPDGLSGDQANAWLEGGLKKHDGDKNDDKISVKLTPIPVKNLKPIQKQIYFDKSIIALEKGGAKQSIEFLTKKTFFIVSSDNYVIDGHHRYLSALLIDPNMKVSCIVIDIKMDTLLPLTLSFSDAVGNKRNK